MPTRKPRPRAEPRPVTNANFLVDLGLGDPRAPEAGFAEVLLPALGEPLEPGRGSSPEPREPRQRLVLRRGVTGAMDLHDWWQRSQPASPATRPRRRPLPPRDVTVTLLGPDGHPVLRWCFGAARPVALHCAPLRANEGVVLMETIEIAFETVRWLPGEDPPRRAARG